MEQEKRFYNGRTFYNGFNIILEPNGKGKARIAVRTADNNETWLASWIAVDGIGVGGAMEKAKMFIDKWCK